MRRGEFLQLGVEDGAHAFLHFPNFLSITLRKRNKNEKGWGGGRVEGKEQRTYTLGYQVPFADLLDDGLGHEHAGGITNPPIISISKNQWLGGAKKKGCTYVLNWR